MSFWVLMGLNTHTFLYAPLFVFVFFFRYLRLMVHMFSFWLYKPSPTPKTPAFSTSDVTVVIPTVDPNEPDLIECLLSVLLNHPKEVRIVTAGKLNEKLVQEKIKAFQPRFPNVKISGSSIETANKRKQIAHVLPSISTAITVLADDHVFWRSKEFLVSIIAPFEDATIGAVAPHKRVRRDSHGFGWKAFWNFLGAIYLERHNFELRATNAVDGGLFVVSGRTAAFRSEILQDSQFLYEYTHERIFFGKIALPNVDDDNFITRWVVRKGWKLKFQQTRNSTMETSLGKYPKFISQVLRWNRTTIRSNAASLLTDRTVWKTQPWCVYAVYLTSFVNFALFYDAVLLYSFTKTTFFSNYNLVLLGTLVLLSYYVFAYLHSFMKLYAMLTFWNTRWGGRNLDHASVESSPLSPCSSLVSSVSTPWGMSKRQIKMTPANVLLNRHAT